MFVRDHMVANPLGSIPVKKPAVGRPAGFTSDHAPLTQPGQPLYQWSGSFSEWSYLLPTFGGRARTGSGCFGIKGFLRISPLPLARLAAEPQICQQGLALVPILVRRPPLPWLSFHHVAKGAATSKLIVTELSNVGRRTIPSMYFRRFRALKKTDYCLRLFVQSLNQSL